MAENSSVHLGDVTTINLTVLKGGVQENVIPYQLNATFDMRLATTMDHCDFEKMVMRLGRDNDYFSYVTNFKI